MSEQGTFNLESEGMEPLAYEAGRKLSSPLSLRGLAANNPQLFTVEDSDICSYDLETEYDSLNIPFFSDDLIDVEEKNNRCFLKSMELSSDFEESENGMSAMNIITCTEDHRVKKIIIKPGNGVPVPQNGKILMQFVMFEEDGFEPFDSTLHRTRAALVDLKNYDLIPGLFIGIKTMQINEVAKFWIHYDLAYGKVGCLPRIQPKGNVVCIVEIVDMVSVDHLQAMQYMTSSELQECSFRDIVTYVKSLKEDGNEHFQKDQFKIAAVKYTRAAGVLEDVLTHNLEDAIEKKDLLFLLYQNLSGALLRLNLPVEACKACRLALRSKDIHDKSCAKTFYRFATAKLNIGKHDDALRLCKEALKREPSNPEILAMLTKINQVKISGEKSSQETLKKMSKIFSE